LEERRGGGGARPSPLARGIAATIIVILGLIVLHGIEIWTYAFLYLGIGSGRWLREAVYFSTITYGAIGYSDAAMAERWRLVSAIEGINGVILIAWSTAFFANLDRKDAADLIAMPGRWLVA
jgi:hypothetical protein